MEDSSIRILEKCVIPELHILQGFVNHLFWDKNGIKDIVGEQKALIWPKKLNAIPVNYHGRVFEGNACKKMLENVDALLDVNIYVHLGIDIGRLKLQPFVAAFKLMNKIVHACFSNVLMDDDLGSLLYQLEKAIVATEVSRTLKLHILLDHVLESLQYLEGYGLGFWSEQAGEAVHKEFLKIWLKYLIKNMDDPTFVIRIKKAIVEFSSINL